jgi:hypothetical protein
MPRLRGILLFGAECGRFAFLQGLGCTHAFRIRPDLNCGIALNVGVILPI